MPGITECCITVPWVIVPAVFYFMKIKILYYAVIIVNGRMNSKGSKNYYVVYRLSDGAFGRSQPLDRGPYRGDVRIDPAPRWNRTSDAILVPGIAHNKTRQLFVIHVLSSGESPSINAAK